MVLRGLRFAVTIGGINWFREMGVGDDGGL